MQKSAMESRKRRKNYVGGLEERVSKCTHHNQELVNKVKNLEQQNESLMTQLRRLQEIVRSTSNKTTQATTCVMVGWEFGLERLARKLLIYFIVY